MVIEFTAQYITPDGMISIGFSGPRGSQLEIIE